MTATETTLYSYRFEHVSLEDILSNCKEQLAGGIALLYSPQDCQVAKLKRDGALYGSNDQSIEWEHIFEARIFTPNHELRWLNQLDGIGKAVLLTESEQTALKGADSISCEFLEQQYLLWGEKAQNQPLAEGWQRLAEARIGKIDVPTDLEIKDRVYLKTREYITAVDDYGNCAVIEERLVGLEVK